MLRNPLHCIAGRFDPIDDRIERYTVIGMMVEHIVGLDAEVRPGAAANDRCSYEIGRQSIVMRPGLAAVRLTLVKGFGCEPRHDHAIHQAREHVGNIDLPLVTTMRQHHVAAIDIDRQAEALMSIVQ